MRDQLIRYVDLLFAGAPESEEIKQEILQNTLDRYDDLIAQGKAPEAAYRLAISGIGDINEILGEPAPSAPAEAPAAPAEAAPAKPWKVALRAIAVGLYILSPTPLFVLQNEIGLCGLLTFVAVATILIVIAGSKKDEDASNSQKAGSPPSESQKMLRGILWVCCIAIYIFLNAATHAWAITWVIFPLCACIQGLITACFDLKEAGKNEN